MVHLKASAITYRPATPADAEGIARLHADSWRRYYRGAYPDQYLDGDLVAERVEVWTERLNRADASVAACTIVAEEGGAVVGFVHTVLNEDPVWGALVDNLHVTNARKGQGVGTQLFTETADALVERAPSTPFYLWVIDRNTDAQAFYRARGARFVERQSRHPLPGERLRCAWPDLSVFRTVAGPVES